MTTSACRSRRAPRIVIRSAAPGPAPTNETCEDILFSIKLVSINLAAVADLDHPDRQLGILNRVDNTVIPLANAVFFLAGELLTPDGPGIFGKSPDPFHDQFHEIVRDGI